MAETKPPKVFISYAWEDELKTWVVDFATRLRLDGINAILDQWETVAGDQLPEFMEKSVRESDFVVFVCTPTYKRKSDRRKGGVGYEGHIITGEIFAKNNHRKFIPVLRKGKWATAAPSWATSKLFIDFRGDPYSEASYQQLLNTLLGKSPTAPPVRDDTFREKIEREAALEKAEREAAEKTAREKIERENAERETSEKTKREKAEREATEKAERETAERAAREKEKREADERVAQEKSREELEREAKKLVDNTQREIRAKKRKYKWERFLSNVRYRLNVVRIYSLPIFFTLIAIVSLFFGMYYLQKNIPRLTQALKSTPQSSQISNEATTATPYAGSLDVEITDDKGVQMMLVPAGEFIMGSNADVALAECQKYRSDCKPSWFSDEEPQQNIYLKDFYIDKYEVTNLFYANCVSMGVCNQPKTVGLSNIYYGSAEFNNYPVVYVDWYMAKTFCDWREGHLPTEAQWEKAARGTDGRTYPWGEGIDCIRANYWGEDDACVRKLTEVGKYWDGKSPYGVFDMTGNVWEWVNSLYQPYPYNPKIKFGYGSEDLESFSNRVLRGGSMSYALGYDARITNRLSQDSDFTSDIVGFRCARDTNP
jgi:formylglycine-generating enzyme required for sulfatase activity